MHCKEAMLHFNCPMIQNWMIGMIKSEMHNRDILLRFMIHNWLIGVDAGAGPPPPPPSGGGGGGGMPEPSGPGIDDDLQARLNNLRKPWSYTLYPVLRFTVRTSGPGIDDYCKPICIILDLETLLKSAKQSFCEVNVRSSSPVELMSCICCAEDAYSLSTLYFINTECHVWHL